MIPSSTGSAAQNTVTSHSAEGFSAPAGRDAQGSSTEPKFGEIYQQIQAKYGEKAQKPREIKKTLGKDDFLRIMITQMKNQDPTNPFKAEQMATEIAQFTSVEQLQNVNQNLNKMAAQNKPLEQMAMTNMIGKVVTVDKGRFPHIQGENDELSFQLPTDASNVQVAVVDEGGDEIFHKDLGTQKAGQVELIWDGVKSNSLPAKAGNYKIVVEAKDDKGRPIDINPQSQTKIIGVTFEGVEPVFLIGNAQRQEKITMRNIVKIESDLGQLNIAEKKAVPPKGPVAPGLPKNFIPFEKGTGSAPFIPQAAPPVTPSAVAQNQNIQGAPGNQQTPVSTHPTSVSADAVMEKGFPNGLKESDESTNQQKGGELK
jgi:flagellar hook assembly protein FlgD